ncbi:MAG: hypothetical protein H8E32_02655 [Nitrospinae bacterium]|nr:hypothetical protein [Nitrospinota bacterium]
MSYKSWHKIKPRERDALLTRIAKSFEANVIPEFDDSLMLEEGAISYLDVGQKRVFGFREKAQSNVPPMAFDKIPPSQLRKQIQEAIFLLTNYRELPNQKVRADIAKRIRAYVAKQIPASLLLGERERRVDPARSSQTQQTAKSLTQYIIKNIRTKDGKILTQNTHDSVGKSGNVYTLLSNLSSGESIEDQISKHRLCDDKITRDCLTYIQKELRSPAKLRAGINMLSPWGWHSLYKSSKS